MEKSKIMLQKMKYRGPSIPSGVSTVRELWYESDSIKRTKKIFSFPVATLCDT